MNMLVLRRLLGIVIILAAAIYWGAKYLGYDAPWFDIPAWAHAPALWISLAVIGTWAFIPVMVPVNGREVSLATQNQSFSMPSEGKPFEFQGNWFVIHHGQYMIWSDETKAWIPYNGVA